MYGYYLKEDIISNPEGHKKSKPLEYDKYNYLNVISNKNTFYVYKTDNNNLFIVEAINKGKC